ncbi:TPA: hypothetical protein DCW54_01560 [Candidatus Dependentiae bacterium]|nr:hypothetical protein [Candidatus Dependentiae bacterium]
MVKRMKKDSFFIARLLSLFGFFAAIVFVSWWQRDTLLAYVQAWIAFVESGIEINLTAYSFGYVALYVLDSVLALPIASLLGFLAGRFFGLALGFFLSMLGMIIGALLAFTLVRYFVGSYFQRRYADKLVRFNEIFSRYGVMFLIFIRFIPIVPFSLVNVLAAFTSMGIVSFFLTTCIGMAPLLLCLVALGHYSPTIVSLDIQNVLVWFSIAGVLGGLIIFLLKKYWTVL